MTAEITDNAVSAIFSKDLNRMTDIRKTIAFMGFFHTTEETLTCIVDQLLRFVADFPTGDRSRCVTVVAIQNGANIEADDIPFANNNVRRRDTMYNNFIDRGADRSWEPAIVLKGRDRSSTPNITLGNLIEFERTHTWA